MPDNTVQQIKDRLNVVDVLGGYLQLKKAGVNYRGLCPFHNERTPSFNVSPQRQIWHCFGCGEGGDIFGFVMKYENLDFKETLKVLAQKAGVELPKFRPQDPKEQEEKGLFLRINDFAARAYHQALLKNGPAMEYLKGRDLSLETVKKWQIGFAPNDFHFLHHALLKKNLKEDVIIRAGVCIKGEKGNVYDRFRGRITFPIFNYFGEVVGFSARILPALDDGKGGKYINSPETLIYNKSRELFGLSFAKDEIRKKDQAVIVEGQMDCISAHQAGFLNTVASSGTALTPLQLDALGRLTKNLKFCFDADQAGLIAARRAGELALPKGFRLKTIVLKGVKDPDELIKKSPGLWEKAVSEAVWFLDFYINLAKEKYKDDPVEQKHYLSSLVVPFLGFIADPLEQDHYIGELVKKFGISEKVIRDQIKNKGVSKSAPAPASLETGKNLLILEKEVLGGLLFAPEFKKQMQGQIEPEDFENPEVREAVLAMLSDNPRQDSVLAKESIFMVESLLEQLGDEALLKRLLKSYSQLKADNLKKKQKVLQSEIAGAEARKDEGALRKLQAEFAQVSKLRTEWEQK